MTSPIETNNVVERARKLVNPIVMVGDFDDDDDELEPTYPPPSKYNANQAVDMLADLIQSLSDRIDVLEGENAELRNERDALLQRPIDLAKMDSIDEDATDRMIAYYWCEQAQIARTQNTPDSQRGGA